MISASHPFEVSNFQSQAQATPQSAIGRGGAAIFLRSLRGLRATHFFMIFFGLIYFD
jgi:hypothetical protein